MPWSKVLELIGPGLHWGKPRSLYLKAISTAEHLGRPDVADHIRIILEQRDRVGFICDEEKEPGAGPG